MQAPKHNPFSPQLSKADHVMNTSKRAGVIAAIVAAVAIPMLVANRSGDNASANDRDDTVSAAAPDTERELADTVTNGTFTLPDGSYAMVGYGTVLVADGDEITPHFVTPSTCTPGEPFDNELDVDHASDDGGQILLDVVGSTTDYRLRPLLAVPECNGDGDESASLTAIDEVFSTHYPFFNERDIDWKTAMTEVRNAVDNGSSVPDSLAAFMLELGDGHTTLQDLDIDVEPTDFGVEGVTDTSALGQLIDTELDDTLAQLQLVNTDVTGNVAWGTFAERPDVGYLFIGSFLGDGNPVDDRTALATALESAVASFDTVERLVIDMRFNTGGFEDLAAIASGHFTTEPVDAYQKWAYAEPDPVVQTVTIEPQAQYFDGAVTILTSPITASAAETFVLAMRPVAEAVVVGTPSFGEFSDAIDWALPDGTEFTISMEVYTDLDGNNFEAVGIPVDVAAPFDESIQVALGLWPEADE